MSGRRYFIDIDHAEISEAHWPPTGEAQAGIRCRPQDLPEGELAAIVAALGRTLTSKPATAPILDRIVASIEERRNQPWASWAVPFVAPAALLEIATLTGERIERIGGASVEVYTRLGWLRVYESRWCKPGEVEFMSEPKERQ
jgi:hypothetical protein